MRAFKPNLSSPEGESRQNHRVQRNRVVSNRFQIAGRMPKSEAGGASRRGEAAATLRGRADRGCNAGPTTTGLRGSSVRGGLRRFFGAHWDHEPRAWSADFQIGHSGRAARSRTGVRRSGYPENGSQRLVSRPNSPIGRGPFRTATLKRNRSADFSPPTPGAE